MMTGIPGDDRRPRLGLKANSALSDLWSRALPLDDDDRLVFLKDRFYCIYIYIRQIEHDDRLVFLKDRFYCIYIYIRHIEHGRSADVYREIGSYPGAHTHIQLGRGKEPGPCI